MIKEYHRFWTAVSFFSQLPVPKKTNYSFSEKGEASKYLPVLGLFVALFQYLIFIATSLILPQNISIILILGIGVILTGAIHEDGFADFIDGFGGGWDKNKILSIMKDSMIGVYGVIGLIFLFVLKYFLLSELTGNNFLIILLSTASLSRATAVSLMFDMNYARIENSKAKSMTGKISLVELLFVILIAIIPLVFFENILVFILLVPVILFRVLIKRYLNKWTQGYTGDCLGFVQQCSELIIYLGFVILLNHGDSIL